MQPSIAIEKQSGIAILTLCRPDVMNAVNSTMRDELIRSFHQLDQDEDVRAIVVTGAGERAFCAGQDLDEALAFRTHEVKGWMQHQCSMLSAIRDCDKPVVTAFNGVATGVGFQIGLVSDYRITSPDTRLGQPEVRVGLASILGSYLMSQFLGHGHNQALSLGGALIDGQRAYELGLVSRLVARDEVVAAAIETAQEYAALPANAIRLTKQRFRVLSQASFEDACRAVAEYQTACYEGGEPQARMGAFVAKRTGTKSVAKG
ncbi:enoyl-CoA hydratase/isomerase family protein [Aestuariirhabdus litorea]|uniref:Enoyl-CoA hydratase/isomerase family protein n=1 Tax=Aestuariirhabdus litorea TaxID=2528527 RepID=A0A3P3VPQ6_9GAMM|nr:enoyl-CoA hydratase/isomerase family protein [Aestuariirhabdus litorea]RRJ82803.1 enoyl-CoA hydratase/isomerase family protein [Aestuariirhabdus litorea]RWW92962.1 enoyl-CoA hydratase/isomerase family protein [Endozoicomonadaceae bacterium GTF-13]